MLFRSARSIYVSPLLLSLLLQHLSATLFQLCKDALSYDADFFTPLYNFTAVHHVFIINSVIQPYSHSFAGEYDPPGNLFRSPSTRHTSTPHLRVLFHRITTPSAPGLLRSPHNPPNRNCRDAHLCISGIHPRAGEVRYWWGRCAK